MSRALSLDLRERVLAAVALGASHRQAGERFGVSAASVSRWRALAGAGGRAGGCPAQGAGGRPPLGAQRGAGGADPGAAGGPARPDHRGATSDPGRARPPLWLWHAPALLRAPSHHAQKRTAHAAEQERPDIVERRTAWRDAQPSLAPERLVFIDETWASTAMTRAHGRAPRGQRLRMGVPYGHWKTTTFVAGPTTRGLIAPWVLDGAINRDAFEAYVAQVPVPELRPGDTVVMDNLSSHKGPKVRRMIETTGAKLLYLPPHSPDLNPIEMAFAKLKALLRRAAERTVVGLWAAIGRLLDSFTPAECQNHFQAAGYPAT